ncbi:MAG: cation:proton antiporter [Gammaproteobacteria bacterium]|nr:cation:proton antiporter [Gammaproteobacteria bacterium]
MHIDPALPIIVGVIVAVLLIGIVLRAVGQPQIVGYLIAGLIIGPHGIGLLEDQDLISRIGGIGLIVLLFFVGMEASPGALLSRWRLAIFGLLLQVGATIGVIWLIGYFFDWSWQLIVLFGFAISLSSTAVVLKLLKDWNELDTQTGQNALVVLLAQDVALAPMIITINLFGGGAISTTELALQLIGALVLVGIAVWVFTRPHVRLPFAKKLKEDHELQVFAALLLCFGLALFSGELGLSTALGAFIAGLVVSSARETDWVHHSLEPFRVVFVAAFFVSVGMLINIDYVLANPLKLALLVFVILVINTLLNAGILRLLGSSWRRATYAGALLSQIGEFSFILIALARSGDIMGEADYQLFVALTAISLALSPAWIGLCKVLLRHPEGQPDNPRIPEA